MTLSKLTISRRGGVFLLSGVLLLGCLSLPTWADPTKPHPSDKRVSWSVANLLNHRHLSGRKLDDEHSRRAIKTYLKSLDPWKVYFYQSDIDSFMKQQNELDDMVVKGDLTFGYRVYQVFLQRIDERVKIVDEMLAIEHDFTVDEEMISDRELAQYPRTAAEARDLWRKRIKYDLLVLKADDMEGEKAKEKLTRRYHFFAKRMHQTNSEELLEMFLTAVTTSFDPHTTYMSPSTLENFEIMMRLQLEGIGASLQSVDGYTVVKKIIPGGAADKDGQLKVEDTIVGVGQVSKAGEIQEIVDTVEMKLSDVVKMIRGKEKSVVRLEVTSVDNPERKIIAITRAKIELKDSEAHGKVFDVGRRQDGSPYQVGVIELPSFYMDMEANRLGDPNYKSTTRDVRRILEDFNAKEVDTLVLDLRRNGGGSLTEAINLTGLFIDEGPVVQVKNSRGRVRAYHDSDEGLAWSGPMVVLIDKFSASASEILAGAIQDYGRGIIVGDHATHGKGTVQSLMDVGEQLFPYNPPPMGALKITMQQFYRPSGDSTQNRGVQADIELPSLTTHLDVGEADLDYPVAFDKVDAISFGRFDYVNQLLVDQIKDCSERRVAQSEDFQKVTKNVSLYKQQKAKKYITLNEEKFLAERAELNADKEEEKTLEELNDPHDSTIKRNFYLDEAMAIAVDCLKLRQVAKAN